MSKLEYEVLVCYDVEDNKARKKLFDLLKDIGLFPIQKSVFWGMLRKAEENAIHRSFKSLLNKDTDRAFLVRGIMAKQIKENAVGAYPSFLDDRFKSHASI